MPYSHLRLPIPTSGQLLTIHYPTCTTIELLTREINYIERSIIVHNIRDLVTDPLTPAEFLRRPYVRRGRWLISAYDCKLNQLRHFYLSSTLEFYSQSQLRIGLYESRLQRPSCLLYRSFDFTIRDIKELVTLLHHIEGNDYNGMTIGIFCDDMRIIL